MSVPASPGLIPTPSLPGPGNTALPASVSASAKPASAVARTRRNLSGKEEVDVWYGGYSSRALAGAMALSVAATLLCQVLGWVVAAQTPGFAREVWLGVAGLIGALWIFQMFCWIYRIVGFQMRLTSRRVFYDRGILYPKKQEVALDQVGRVEVIDQILDQFLAVGQLTLYGEGAAGSLLVMTGVPQPRIVADLIRQQSAKLRQSDESLSDAPREHGAAIPQPSAGHKVW